MSVLFTIGYQGCDLRSLIRVLAIKRIDEIVDVRLTPVSRKAGFSGSVLARALAAKGIAYQHRRDLGCPKDIRTRYRLTGDFHGYTRSYRHRVLERATESVQELARGVASRRLCLLCFEENPFQCHRSLVADETRRASQKEVRVDHLDVASSGRTCR